MLIDNGTVRLSITGGGLAGHAQLSADSNRDGIEARDVSELWIGPAAIAALQLPLVGSAGLRFGLEAGVIARPSSAPTKMTTSASRYAASGLPPRPALSCPSRKPPQFAIHTLAPTGHSMPAPQVLVRPAT